MKLSNIVRRYPATFYFVLAYLIAWGGILLIVGPTNLAALAGEATQTGTMGIEGQVMLVFAAMLAGPSIAGLLMARIVDGRSGPGRILSGITRWRVSVRWYAAALLVTPAVLLAMLAGLSLLSPDYRPGLALGMGLAGGLMAGFFEEIGWTGFALPRLQARYSPLVAGLILGVIHTVWHLLADAWFSLSYYGGLYVSHFLLWVVALTAFRLIAVWVYNRSGSLLLAQLTHAAFTGSQLVFDPPAVSATQAVLWYAVFAGALVLVAALVVLTARDLFTALPRRDRLAAQGTPAA